MKKLLEMKYTKLVLFIVMFVVSSICCYYGEYLCIPLITHYGRGILQVFPSAVAFFTPLVTMCFAFMFWYVKNEASKWKIALSYSLIQMLMSIGAIFVQIVFIAKEFGPSVRHTPTLLFPYDVLIFLFIFLALGALVMVWCVKNRKNREIEIDQSKVIKKRSLVAFWTMMAFSTYFMGVGLSSVLTWDHFDPNLYGIIPAVLSFFLMPLGCAMYGWYRLSDESKRKNVYLIGLFVSTTATLLLYLWILIAFLINKNIFPESLSQFYALGFAIKIPFGLFINLLGIMIPCLVAFIRYCKRYFKEEKN